MNITYILGNGFDLNFNMRTKYEHFYDYYKNQNSKVESVVALKNRMFEELKQKKTEIDWSDLESELGLFTKRSGATIEEFDLFLSDMCKHLMDYLKLQNELFTPTDNIKNVLTTRFGTPASFLRERYATMVTDFINDVGTRKNINILTFNYTDVVERIIEKYIPLISKGALIQNAAYKMPIHIHNNLNELTLGVNDKSQIASEAFKNDEDFVRSFVKPELCHECGNDNHIRGKAVINETDLFVVFGASLGQTDKLWAEAIGKTMLNNDSMLVYFSYQDELNPVTHRNKPKTKRAIWRNLKKVMKLSDKDFEYLEERIIIDFNEKKLFGNYSVEQPVLNKTR